MLRLWSRYADEYIGYSTTKNRRWSADGNFAIGVFAFTPFGFAAFPQMRLRSNLGEEFKKENDMDLNQFAELVKALGPTGVFVGIVVLVIIYLAKFGGLIKNGNVARIVNIVLSVVFGGYQFGDDKGAFVSVIAALASALLFELIQWVSSRLPAKGFLAKK